MFNWFKINCFSAETCYVFDAFCVPRQVGTCPDLSGASRDNWGAGTHKSGQVLRTADTPEHAAVKGLSELEALSIVTLLKVIWPDFGKMAMCL